MPPAPPHPNPRRPTDLKSPPPAAGGKPIALQAGLSFERPLKTAPRWRSDRLDDIRLEQAYRVTTLRWLEELVSSPLFALKARRRTRFGVPTQTLRSFLTLHVCQRRFTVLHSSDEGASLAANLASVYRTDNSQDVIDFDHSESDPVPRQPWQAIQKIMEYLRAEEEPGTTASGRSRLIIFEKIKGCPLTRDTRAKLPLHDSLALSTDAIVRQPETLCPAGEACLPRQNLRSLFST